MTISEEERVFERIHDLATSLLEGRAGEADRAELDAIVRQSATAEQIFRLYMQDTAQLRWWAGGSSSEVLCDLAEDLPQPAGRRLAAIWATVLAAVAIVAVLTPFVRRGGGSGAMPLPDRNGVGVAMVTRLADVRWVDGAREWEELSRLAPGDSLLLDHGEIELVFDIGVAVVIRGPAVFEVRASDRAFSGLGMVTARVGETGQGFVLETPVAKVVDLGTEFSVDVAATGSTDVAVFRGLVDLSVTIPESAIGGPARRLRQGEALTVGTDGSLDRVMAIASDRFPTRTGEATRGSATAPLIVDVRDNGAAEVRKFYRIVRTGLYEDAPAFVDRDHQWNGVDGSGIPAFLRGLEYVMPYNDDKYIDQLEVAVTLARPAVLYVFVSDDVPRPEWLSRDFVDTGYDIGLDEAMSRSKPTRKNSKGSGKSIDTVFSVWRREVADAMTVSLGSVERPPRGDGYNMYGIAAAPLPERGDGVR